MMKRLPFSSHADLWLLDFEGTPRLQQMESSELHDVALLTLPAAS